MSFQGIINFKTFIRASTKMTHLRVWVRKKNCQYTLYTVINYSTFLHSGFYYSSLRCNNENELTRLDDVTQCILSFSTQFSKAGERE